MRTKKKTKSRKHTGGKNGGRPFKEDERTKKDPWKDAPKALNRDLYRVIVYVPPPLFERMENVSPMLINFEKQKPGAGIKKNTPGLYGQYAIERLTQGLEEITKNAIAPVTHNDG